MKRIPSLNINITDKCNFNCIYCPQYGESLEKAINLCDEKSILLLLDISRKTGINVLRITGGEPLLKIKRTIKIIDFAIEKKYKKIILNTNGFLLGKYFEELKKFKDYITLKISIDSLNHYTFFKLTGSNNLDTIKNNLLKYVNYGFNVGINTVVTKYNYKEVYDLIGFADRNSINLKFLGVSNFGSEIDNSELAVSFDELLNKVKEKYPNFIYEKLIGNVGITMPTIELSNSKVFFVDHDSQHINNKLFSQNCIKNCSLYPCETGLLHIALSASGNLRYCRLLKYSFFSIVNCQSEKKLENILNNFINEFNQK